MKVNNKAVPFSAASFPPLHHSLYAGGIAMEVTHQHPKYANQKERLERLQDVNKACLMKIYGLRNSAGAA